MYVSKKCQAKQEKKKVTIQEIYQGSYVDIESTNTFFFFFFFFYLSNKNKIFGTKSKQTVNFLNISKKPFPLIPSKKHIMKNLRMK